MGAQSKFSLLTYLTLNATGFNSGINSATKSAEALTKGTQSASTSISKAFGGISSMIGTAFAPLQGLQSAVMGGISAFKLMIPAINSVNVALISTGIGAIIVALGIALAGVMSYLTGTSEGANKLKLAFAAVSGVINTIMIRMKSLGSAIVNLFSGDFAKMKEDLEAAFKGDFLDDMNSNIKESIELSKEDMLIGKMKRQLITDEANALNVIAKLNYDTRNSDAETMLGAKEKLNAIKKELQLMDQLAETKKNIANLEYQSFKRQLELKGGASKTTSVEKTKLAELAATITNLDTANWDAKASKMKIYSKLVTKVATEEALKQYEADRLLFEKNNNDKAKITDNEIAKTNKKSKTGFDDKPTLKKSVFSVAYKFSGDDEKDSLKINEDRYKKGLIAFEAYQKNKSDISKKYGEERKNTEQNITDTVGLGLNLLSNLYELSKNKELQMAGNNANKKAEIEKKYAKKQKTIAIGTALMNGAVAFTKALELPPPFNWIEAGLIGASTAAQVGIISSQGFANGGVVGGYSFSGDKIPARVNSGEMILNRGQQGNLFSLLNSGAGAGGGGELTTKISGSDLLIVLNNANRNKINKF